MRLTTLRFVFPLAITLGLIATGIAPVKEAKTKMDV